MRGEVLHYDEAQGFGFITGADGNRYGFGREDLAKAFHVARGTPVEFQALLTIDLEALQRLADRTDPRIQRASREKGGSC